MAHKKIGDNAKLIINMNKGIIEKHAIAFERAQYAFADPNRVIARDKRHGTRVKRYQCFGTVDGGVLTVRFTHRGECP